VEEGDYLASGAALIGAEFCDGGALGDFLLHGPEHGLIVIGAGLHIGEGLLVPLGFGQPAARQRKVTTWPRVQVPSGAKVVSVVPFVISFSTAQRTAS
jgi:hypothetical protein